jgi:hypothetical protein
MSTQTSKPNLYLGKRQDGFIFGFWFGSFQVSLDFEEKVLFGV